MIAPRRDELARERQMLAHYAWRPYLHNPGLKRWLHRIDLRVFDFNQAAIAAYERVGFKKEGLLRDACKVGEAYWSAWVMSMLEDEWRDRPDR